MKLERHTKRNALMELTQEETGNQKSSTSIEEIKFCR